MRLGNLPDTVLTPKSTWGGEQGLAEADLPRSYLHLLNEGCNSVASTGKMLGWFLVEWKMGGSQRQCKESHAKWNPTRLEVKQTLC